MFYDLLLNTSESPWGRAVGAGLGAVLLGVILYAIEFLRE